MSTKINAGNLVVYEGGWPPAGSRLTPRERQVLQGISDGFTSRELAERWGISANTIRGYRDAALRKLGVHDIRSAVELASRRGWIE